MAKGSKSKPKAASFLTAHMCELLTITELEFPFVPAGGRKGGKMQAMLLVVVSIVRGRASLGTRLGIEQDLWIVF